MTTPITFYLTAQASATLSTANQLYTVAGAPTSQENQTQIGIATGWGQVHAQTQTGAWPSLGSIGAPDGNGWFYDLNTLDNQAFGAASWSGSMRSGLKTTGSTVVVTFSMRIFRYSGGIYTNIVTLVSPQQTYVSSSAVSIALAAVTGTGGISFAPGDLLYVDLWGNITTNTGGIATQKFRSGNLSTDASGLTGDANQSIISPGYDVGVVVTPPTTTPLTVYGTTVASTTLTTACVLATTTGGTSTSKTTTCTDNTGTHYWYMEVMSKGGSNGDVATLPAPTGKGYLLDNVSLENQIISAGNWNAIVRISDATGFASVDLIIRAYIYNSGTYTYIGTLQDTHVALTGTATNFTMPNVALGDTTFNTNDKLYFDFFVFANGSGGHWSSDPIVSYASSNGSAGIANQFVVNTPGFVPSLVTNVTNFAPISTKNNASSFVTSSLELDTIALIQPISSIQSNSIVIDRVSSTDLTITLGSPNIATITTTTINTNTTNEIYSVQSRITINDPVSWSDFFSIIGRVTTSETIVISDVFINTQYRSYVDTIAIIEFTSDQPIQVSFDTTRLIEAYSVFGIGNIIETTFSKESVSTAASSPVPVDPASQMLYATLQMQYTRIRQSSTNARIQLIALVYYVSSTALITSEYGVPGGIDILLIGEDLSQLHILKTVNDVNAFLAAYP